MNDLDERVAAFMREHPTTAAYGMSADEARSCVETLCFLLGEMTAERNVAIAERDGARGQNYVLCKDLEAIKKKYRTEKQARVAYAKLSAKMHGDIAKQIDEGKAKDA